MSIEPKKMFACCNCGRRHDRRSSAEECCPPEVATVWICPTCGDHHDIKADAEKCCEALREEILDSCVCPCCLRDHGGTLLQQIAISIAGHCTTCNPTYSLEQQFAIEDLIRLNTGRHERLNA